MSGLMRSIRMGWRGLGAVPPPPPPPPPPTLGTLALSSTTFTVDTPSSGTITGATVGSTITASGLPTGLTINGVARTWAWDGTGTAGSGSFTLTETLLGAVGSPKTTTINYTVNAGAGTLSAATIGYPSPIAANPATILIHIPVDWQSGDVLKLARSSSSAMSSPTFLTHTLTDADIIAGTFSIGLSGVTLSGITYFQALGSHSGVDSANLSNIVAWGDTTAPVITTSGTQSITETSQLAVALAATDTGGVPALLSDGSSPGWYLSGGADRLQFQLAIVLGVVTLQWVGNGSQIFDTGDGSRSNAFGFGNTYNVQITAVDYSGNQSALLSMGVSVTQIDQTPDAYSFTNVSNAPHSTLETSNTVTISGLQPGFNISSTFTGSGTYSKNGGAFVSTSPFTARNGDTFTLQTTSGSADNMSITLGLNIGLGSATWTVSTPLTVTDTTTTGTNKSKFVNATSYQAIVNAIVSTAVCTRSTSSQGNVGWYVEGTINGFGTGGITFIGVDDGSVDLNNGGTGNYPGNTEVPGQTYPGFLVYCQAGATSINIITNGSTSTPTLPSSQTVAIGDTIGIAYNSTTKVLNVYYFKNGFGDLGLVGTSTLSSQIPANVYIVQGGFSGNGTAATSDSITTNYGGVTSYVRTPPGGSSHFA